MRFLIPLIAILMVSCGSGKDQKQIETAEIESDSSSDTTWVNRYFVNEELRATLSDNLSPFSTAGSMPLLTEVHLYQNEMLMVLNNAEGVNEKLVKEEDFVFTGANGTVLTIDENSSKITYEGNEYPLCMLLAVEENNSAYEYLVQQMLFEGKWETTNGDEIIFTADGKVIGLNNYVSYEPMTRFGEMGDFDMISFKDAKGKTFWYAWNRRGNQLSFYSLTEGEEYLNARGILYLEMVLVNQQAL